MTAKTAQRGRLEGVFTPIDSDVAWGPKMIRGLVESIQKWATKGTGYLVLGGAAKFQSVTATPREMEFAEQRKDTRDAVLATFSVPPARLSLPTANFATQKQQMRTYWESLKGGTGSAVEDGLTWLARKMGHPGDTVVFDYSGVESLQEGMGERLARVGQHILNGITAEIAYQIEGIEVPDGAFTFGLPAVDGAEGVDEGVPAESEAAVVSEVSLNGAQIQSAIAIVSLVAEGKLPRPVGVQMLVQFFGLTEDAAEAIMGDVGVSFFIEEGDEDAARALASRVTRALLPSSEEERSATWRAFLDGVHKPAERDIHIATMRYLLQAAQRYAKRIEEVGGRDTQTRATKALDDAQILAILSENEEMDHAIRALERPMKTALLRSFRASVLRMGTSLAFDPGLSILHEATRQTAVQITTMQSNVLRSLLSLLNQGATINEVQASLMTSHAFSATRSLRIARTEATRFVNAGADQAYGQALASGLAVRKQWLTARDGEVRTSHMALDGQTVDAGEEFTSSSGSTARFPGGFGIASLDINCRCTTIPVLEAS
jgi:hypothetical protein